MGITTCGIFGDILTARMFRRNVTALVTDGAVRDKAGVIASKLPVWCDGVCVASLGEWTDVCRLAGADRLRRLRDLSRAILSLRTTTARL